ncbi:MAG: glycosyltransferase family 87 protein, partial [Gemmatales bacterium]|nr:glycosyltransferase family 87 protein [Gemmatales bacterium]
LQSPTAVEERSGLIRWLLVWGGGGLVNYVILAYLSQQFVFGQGHTERPIVQVVAVLAAAWLSWCAACYVAFRRVRPTAGSSPSAELWPLGVVLLFAVAYRMVLIPTRPIQEADLYRYLWDGLLTVNGINPYSYTPAELAERLTQAYLEHQRGGVIPQDDVLLRFSHIVREDLAHNRQLFYYALAHHGQMPTTYPPVAQAVFALVALLCPDSWSVMERVIMLKTVLVGFDLGTLAVLLLVLRHIGWPMSWCVVYAWCPLVLKEVANSGHVESVAVFCCTLSWWLLVRQRWAWAGCTWALAVLSKVYPLALSPLLFGWLTRRGGPTALVRFFALGMIAIALSVWWVQPDTRSAATGLAIFLREWEMNDFLFEWTKTSIGWLLPEAWQNQLTTWPGWPRRRATGSPEEHMQALTLWCALAGSTATAEVQRFGLLPVSPQFVFAYALHAVIYLFLITTLTCRAWRADSPAQLAASRSPNRRDAERPLAEHPDGIWLRATFYALAWLFLLVPTGNPWYWLWALPWMVWARQSAWYLLVGLLGQYYLYFWFVYHYPTASRGVWDTGLPGYLFFHQVWVWLEYAPFYLMLMAEYLAARLKLIRSPFGAHV